MNRKTVCILIATILLVSSILLGCDSRRWEEEEASLADKRSEQVMTAIINKDAESLKTLFSEHVHTEVENLDDQINELFEYFDGEITSWERSYEIGSHAHTTYGVVKERYIIFFCNITTITQEYEIGLKELIVNKEYPEKVGLHSLNANIKGDIGQYPTIAGVVLD